MIINFRQSIIIIVVVALCTFLTRAFPFILFGRNRKIPDYIRYLGEILPQAVITILVVYCLKNVNFNRYSNFIPQVISVFIVAVIHIWKRNNLFSIGIGTAVYMLLIQYIFV